MNARKILNAGLGQKGSTEWMVKSQGGQRLLYARLLVIFGPTAILFIMLNIVLDDSGSAACIGSILLVLAIPIAISRKYGTNLTIHELTHAISITR